MTKKITLHRALGELKLIEKRIIKKISEINPIGLRKKDGLVNNITKLDDFNNSAKSDYQSIDDLFKQRLLIKSKLAQANSVIEIKIAGEKMTITDAINQKHMIGLRKEFIQNLKNQYANYSNKLESHNKTVEENAFRLAETVLGKDNVKAGSTDVLSITNPYKEANELKIIDPLGLLKIIEQLTEDVENFESEVDTVLSEANATNFIEV